MREWDIPPSNCYCYDIPPSIATIFLGFLLFLKKLFAAHLYRQRSSPSSHALQFGVCVRHAVRPLIKTSMTIHLVGWPISKSILGKRVLHIYIYIHIRHNQRIYSTQIYIYILWFQPVVYHSILPGCHYPLMHERSWNDHGISIPIAAWHKAEG